MTVDKPTDSTDSTESTTSLISVSVRVRPFTATEHKNLISVEHDVFLGDASFNAEAKPEFAPLGIRKIVDVVDDKMLIFDPPESNPIAKLHRQAFPQKPSSRIREHRFVFDRLFDCDVSQTQVFEATTKPLLDSILDGFNATVFAYGATGCGKTHTILGTPDDPGIIMLTMEELYLRMELLTDKVFEVSLSYLEIYNEQIRDLLDPQISLRRLVIREDTNHQVFVANLSAHKPQSVEEVMQMVMAGNKNRTSSATEANATSSRSHAVLQINVILRAKSVDLQQQHTFATLSIIDLAGSERASATKNTGARLHEGANINKLLLALGNCINALCDPRKRNHIPYRDSKLTRLLKFSLGGNCKTVMIVCVSPLSQHYDETLNTLKYADRAKMIKTKVVRNQHRLDRHVGSYLKMITEQKLEIEELRTQQQAAVNTAVAAHRQHHQQIIALVEEAVDSLRRSVFARTGGRWQRYFVLAKRKVLLTHKAQYEAVLAAVLARGNSVEGSSDSGDAGEGSHQASGAVLSIIPLLEQVLAKLSMQIQQLELQYSELSDADFVMGDARLRAKQRLLELPQWLEAHGMLFDAYAESIRVEYERDVLFQSSVLYDHLVTEMSEMGVVLAVALAMSAGALDVEAVSRSLEAMVNGDFDAQLEECLSRFMRLRVDQDAVALAGATTGLAIGANRSATLAGDTTGFAVSPASIALVSGPSKMRRPSKFRKVHFDESDISYDDSSVLQDTFRSDADDSPVQHNILDHLNDDELSQRFDPSISSPPLKKPVQLSVKKPRRVSLLTNKRLDDSKVPLLNKRGSKLVDKPPHWRVSSNPSELMQFALNPETRNIGSNRSEDVT